jgi:hypothetical protein
LNLTINQPTTATVTETACGSFTFNGTTYNQSGTYTQNSTNAAGCAHTTTLNLTINQPTTATITETACGSFTFNGTTYNQSGTYTQNSTNAAGCAHTTTLNLTINQPTTATITETACGSFTFNGTTYNQSGTYTQNSTNAAGCAHTTTLYLTVVSPDVPSGSPTQIFTEGDTLADIVVSPSSVIWYASEADALSHSNPLSITTTLVSSTYYAVNVIGACFSSPFAVTVTVNLSAPSFEGFKITVYPNPAIDYFMVRSEQNIERVYVYNLLGREVLSQPVRSTEAKVDTSLLAAGVYMIKVASGDKVAIMKIIKK